MKLLKSRIIGVESSSDQVKVQMQIAGSEDTSKPVEVTMSMEDMVNTVIVNCQFSGLKNNQVVATRRELGTNGLARLYINKV